MDTLGKRIKYAIKWYKKNVDNSFTQRKFAKIIGVTDQTISDLANDVYHTSKFIPQISSYLGFSSFWLATGSGEQFNTSLNPHVKKTLKNHIPILKWEEIFKWCLNDDHSLDLSVDQRKYIATPIPNDDHNTLFAVVIDNETMNSLALNEVTFPKGCIVIADPLRMPKPGEYMIGVWKDNKKPIFRQYIEEGDKKYIKPIATQFQSEEINENFIPLATAIERRDDLIS